MFELGTTSICIGVLVHWSENQPVQCEVFREKPQSHGDLGFGKLGDCAVFYNKNIQNDEEGQSKWSYLSNHVLQIILCKAQFYNIDLKSGV